MRGVVHRKVDLRETWRLRDRNPDWLTNHPAEYPTMKLRTRRYMRLTNLMPNDEVKIEKAFVGLCACKQPVQLYRVTIDEELFYACKDCLRAAMRIIKIKGEKR